MWIITKKVGVFTHYLNSTGTFTPSIDKASKFSSQEMADIMAKKYGGTVEAMK
jgi:hypothetical protein